MLNFIKKLFGSSKPSETAPVGVPAFNPKYVAELEKSMKPVEFHEEIKQQVESKKSKPATKKKAPAKKAAAKKPAAKKAPAKIKAEKKSK